MDEQSEDQILSVFREEVVAEKRATATGSVRVQKRVSASVENVDIPIVKERVDVRRVPIGRVIDQVPPTRKEGDTTIISVVEEEVVVTKRLVLKEEIHLTKTRKQELNKQTVTLETEHAEILRMDASGRVVASSLPDEKQRGETKRTIGRQPSILSE